HDVDVREALNHLVLAARVAAVEVLGVAVVALLGAADPAVAAHDRLNGAARRVAAAGSGRVALLAPTAVDEAVAAHGIHAQPRAVTDLVRAAGRAARGVGPWATRPAARYGGAAFGSIAGVGIGAVRIRVAFELTGRGAAAARNATLRAEIAFFT